MLALIHAGKKVEAQLGTVPFIITVFIFVLINSFTESVFYLLRYLVMGTQEYFLTCTLGLSGPLLSLTVIFVYKFATAESLKLIGPVAMPYSLYPWILLLITMLLPDASLASCVIGLVLGFAYVHGLISFLFPGKAIAVRMESSARLKGITARNGFVSATPSTLPTTSPLTATPVTSE